MIAHDVVAKTETQPQEIIEPKITPEEHISEAYDEYVTEVSTLLVILNSLCPRSDWFGLKFCTLYIIFHNTSLTIIILVRRPWNFRKPQWI